jgi:predicted ATPase
MKNTSIKLAITGSHSTGKTTLIDYIEAHTRGMRITDIRGIARSVIRRGFPMAKEATEAAFANYIHDQLRAQRVYDPAVCDLLMVDRCIACAIGYARTNRAQGVIVPEFFVEMMEEVARLESRFFDAYIFLPIEFPPASDPLRPVDEPYRCAVNDCILSTVKTLGFPIHVVKGSVQQRADMVHSIVSGLRQEMALK